VDDGRSSICGSKSFSSSSSVTCLIRTRPTWKPSTLPTRAIELRVQITWLDGPLQRNPEFRRPRSAAKRDPLDRDGKRCIITKKGNCTESAHIYPYSLRESAGPKCARYWAALSMFWPESTIDEWKPDVFGGSNTELCANRITLSSETHVYWDKGHFALKTCFYESASESSRAGVPKATLMFHGLSTRATNYYPEGFPIGTFKHDNPDLISL
jgi:hypothetical protein